MLLKPPDADEMRTRRLKKRFAQLTYERRRREDLHIQSDGKDWYDRDTGAKLTDEEILAREVAYEKKRPSPNDLQGKVIVDQHWLTSKLGGDAFEEAINEGRIKLLTDWL
jgi:hypothetical protein